MVVTVEKVSYSSTPVSFLSYPIHPQLYSDLVKGATWGEKVSICHFWKKAYVTLSVWYCIVINFLYIDPLGFHFRKINFSISKCNFDIFSISYLILRHFGHAYSCMCGLKIPAKDIKILVLWQMSLNAGAQLRLCVFSSVRFYLLLLSNCLWSEKLPS